MKKYLFIALFLFSLSKLALANVSAQNLYFLVANPTSDTIQSVSFNTINTSVPENHSIIDIIPISTQRTNPNNQPYTVYGIAVYDSPNNGGGESSVVSQVISWESALIGVKNESNQVSSFATQSLVSSTSSSQFPSSLNFAIAGVLNITFTDASNTSHTYNCGQNFAPVILGQGDNMGIYDNWWMFSNISIYSKSNYKIKCNDETGQEQFLQVSGSSSNTFNLTIE